jgi:tetratricopeptide (TPR) repeat protein
MRFLLFLLLPLSTIAQYSNDQSCHFAVATAATETAEDLNGYSIPLYKHETVRAVYAKLCLAAGDNNRPLPGCRLVRMEKYVASFSFKLKQITMEEKAYDLCAALGADSLNALAAMISHELIHFYDRHSHEADENTKRNQEWAADLKGGMLAQRAGFQVFGVQEKLINGIYSSYGLPATMKGYPPQDERVKLAEKLSTQLERLWYRFKLANLMTVTGDYDAALAYYQSVADTFPSREILQNLSTVYALRGLEHWTKITDGAHIAFPFELDPESRLSKGARAVEDTMNMARIEMQNNLNDALNLAQQAVLFDENYVPARVNKACALMLLGRFGEASRAIREVAELASDHDAGNGLVSLLRGNLLYLEREADYEKKALKHWTTAQKSGNALAAANLNLVSKSPGSTPTQITGEKEKMDGFLIDKYLLNLDIYDYSTAVPVVNTVSKIKVGASEEKHYTGARTKGLNASYILIDFVSENRKSVWQCTRPEHRTETLKGISNSSTEQDVLEKYGPPSGVVQTPLGRYLLYRKSMIIFQIENGRVGEWVVYRVVNK